MTTTLIIGASYAGLQAAATAREMGYDGDIRILSAEPGLPYHRPPLSKGYLLGKADADAMTLRGEAFFAAQAIDFVPNTMASDLDLRDRVVTADDGSRWTFDRLVIATGARARSLPWFTTSPPVFSLRTFADAVALHAALKRASHVVIAGGGFIGLEVAATARELGLAVTLVEAEPRLLQRAVSPVLGDVLLALHRQRGTRIILGEQVVAAHGADLTDAVTCGGGERIACDLVLVGVGAVADQDIALRAGIVCGNGIRVDASGRASADGIFAAGDCSCHVGGIFARPTRLECVQNATNQGRAVGAALAGAPKPYAAVPRFWSDQFGHRIQSCGLAPSDTQDVVRGTAPDSFSVFRFQSGRLVAVESVNRARDQIAGRKLLASGSPLTPDEAADESHNLARAGTLAIDRVGAVGA